MKPLKYTELLDYILKALKEIKPQTQDKFVSLVSFLKIFKYPFNYSDVPEIAKYLEARGFIKALPVIGDVRVQITTSGLVYVENKETIEPDFVVKYEAFVKMLRDENDGKTLMVRLSDENYNPKKTIGLILDAIVTKIEGDYKLDAEVIRLELSKSNPDLKLIEFKINNLEQNQSIKEEVNALRNHFNLQ